MDLFSVATPGWCFQSADRHQHRHAGCPHLLFDLGIAAPLVWLHDDWWLALLAPALLLGLIIAGWGPFQGMDAGKFTDAHSPVTWIFDHAGLRVGVSPWRCYIGMAAAGMLCMAPSGAGSLSRLVATLDIQRAFRGCFGAISGRLWSPFLGRSSRWRRFSQAVSGGYPYRIPAGLWTGPPLGLSCLSGRWLALCCLSH
jgi:hypothetical protein